MPKMFFATDGRRPTTQKGRGTPIRFDEIQAIFGSQHMRFFGSEAPSINPEQPSASLQNVVLEVEGTEGVTAQFPEAGFYLVDGVTTETAESMLLAHRATS